MKNWNEKFLENNVAKDYIDLNGDNFWMMLWLKLQGSKLCLQKKRKGN